MSQVLRILGAGLVGTILSFQSFIQAYGFLFRIANS